MRLRSAALSTAGLLSLAACVDKPAPLAPTADVPSLATASGSTGKHVVQFKADAVPADFASRVAAVGGTVEASYDGAGIAVVAGLSDATAAKLGKASDVGSVNPDVEFQVLDPVDVQVSDASADGAESQENPAAAFFFPRQWHLRQIGADRAWAAGKLGSSDVKVAILDTGIDYTYPDLAGLVDLTLSKSFVPSDQPLIDANFPGAHEVADLHYHGTHVAATVSSNGIVAAGVTSKTTLFGVKVLSAQGRGSSSGVLAGIVYAANAGADVINMSLGGTTTRRDLQGFIGDINRAVNYARRQGVVVVVSAGNSAIDLDHDGNGYKTYCDAPTTMCVSATGPTRRDAINGPWYDIDALASYSNYGRSAINVAAPGGNRGGAVVAGCSKFSLQFRICATGNYVLSASGTSMASPHTSGLAALVVAEIGHDRPSQVIAKIQQSADDLGQPGTDPAYGKGRINVANALGL